MLSRLPASWATVFVALVLTTKDGTAQPPAAVQADIDEVVKLLRAKKVDRVALAKKVAAIKDTHELNDLMVKAYKPTKSHGIGYDPKKKGPGDGIEKRISDLGTRKELTKEQLAAEKDLLLRAAYYNLALHEITKAYVPLKPIRGKGARLWNHHNAEVDVGTKAAIAAIEANDPKALKKAMGRVGGGCNGCHADFG